MYLNEERLKKYIDEKVGVVRRWVEVFSSFKQECIPHKNIKLLIECALSCLVTNAAVERVFSLGNDYGSGLKNETICKDARCSFNG